MWRILFKKKEVSWGPWVAQPVKCPTLDVGTGHDLRVVRSGPVTVCTVCGACLGFSLWLPLDPAPRPACPPSTPPSLKKKISYS